MYSDEEELPSYKPNTKPTAAPTSSMLGEDTKPQPTTALSPYTKPRPTKAPSPSVLHEVMKFVSWSKYELVPTLYDHQDIRLHHKLKNHLLKLIDRASKDCRRVCRNIAIKGSSRVSRVVFIKSGCNTVGGVGIHSIVSCSFG